MKSPARKSRRGPPTRIGDYRILGSLAVGGMAEIFLGRREGTAGFKRPVVIKRILPHLAKDRSFVRMFLDEARITSALRHKNVIRVEELERENDDLYMVMEYLAGESLAELTRALRRRNKTLGPQLAAYLVAEACAGLHAAHTMKNESGEPLGVVHRDISPQNLFLGYNGSLKVLDFGIAHARFRLTKTESGYVKGKFDYMSPEQVTNEGLDPRSDVFALGIVLYELLTGIRLFKRSNPAATINAVLTHEVEPPSTLAEGVSEAIDAVCLKALSRDRETRYESALSLREALLACLPPDGEERAARRLPKLMRALFREEIEAKTEMLVRAKTAADATGSDEESLSGARARNPLGPSPTELSDAPTVVGHSVSRPSSRPLWPLAAAATILVVGAIGAALALWPVAPEVPLTKAATPRPAAQTAAQTPATDGARTARTPSPPATEHTNMPEGDQAMAGDQRVDDSAADSAADDSSGPGVGGPAANDSAPESPAPENPAADARAGDPVADTSAEDPPRTARRRARRSSRRRRRPPAAEIPLWD